MNQYKDWLDQANVTLLKESGFEFWYSRVDFLSIPCQTQEALKSSSSSCSARRSRF